MTGNSGLFCSLNKECAFPFSYVSTSLGDGDLIPGGRVHMKIVWSLYLCVLLILRSRLSKSSLAYIIIYLLGFDGYLEIPY